MGRPGAGAPGLTSVAPLVFESPVAGPSGTHARGQAGAGPGNIGGNRPPAGHRTGGQGLAVGPAAALGGSARLVGVARAGAARAATPGPGGLGRGLPPGAAVAAIHRLGGTFGGLGAEVCRPACTQGMTVASSETERSLLRALQAGATWTGARVRKHRISDLAACPYCGGPPETEVHLLWDCWMGGGSSGGPCRSPPLTPPGEGAKARGGQQGVGRRCHRRRQEARAAAIRGGGGALSPSPPSSFPPSSSQGLADIFGNISRQLTVARAGVPAPGVGAGRPPGVADSSSGGGQEKPTNPHPTGDGSGVAVAATSAARAGKAPPSGAVTGHQGESLPPSPPQKRAQRAGGKRVGQPRRPMQTLCDEHRAPACKSCRGHRGVRHCCSRHHEGHPRVLGGGQRCLPVQRGGLQQQAGVLPSGGPALVPGPVTGGEGGDPAGQGTAASPRGGTQGPDQGHRRASEEGT